MSKFGLPTKTMVGRTYIGPDVQGLRFILDLTELDKTDQFICTFGKPAYSLSNKGGFKFKLIPLFLDGCTEVGSGQTKWPEETSIDFSGGELYDWGVKGCERLPIKFIRFQSGENLEEDEKAPPSYAENDTKQENSDKQVVDAATSTSSWPQIKLKGMQNAKFVEHTIVKVKQGGTVELRTVTSRNQPKNEQLVIWKWSPSSSSASGSKKSVEEQMSKISILDGVEEADIQGTIFGRSQFENVTESFMKSAIENENKQKCDVSIAKNAKGLKLGPNAKIVGGSSFQGQKKDVSVFRAQEKTKIFMQMLDQGLSPVVAKEMAEAMVAGWQPE